MTLKKKDLENTLGKGESADNQHFLLFPQCFLLLSKRDIINLAMFNLSSEDAFNLDQSKILSFGKGPNLYKTKSYTSLSGSICKLQKKDDSKIELCDRKGGKHCGKRTTSIFAFSSNVLQSFLSRGH